MYKGKKVQILNNAYCWMSLLNLEVNLLIENKLDMEFNKSYS